MSKGSSTTANKEITCDPLNFFCTAEALWLTDNFYNNTEIHWHVVKWPPSSHLKALSENHACENWEKGGKGKPCIRRHYQSWGRTCRRRWCRRLSYLCLTLSRLAQEAPKSVLREELARTKIERPTWFRTKTRFFFFWGPQFGSSSSATLNGMLVCLTLPRLAQEVSKNVLCGGAVTHKMIVVPSFYWPT